MARGRIRRAEYVGEVDVLMARPGAVTEVTLGPCGAAPVDLVDVDFGLPGGGRRRVPAFRRAGQWVVRYAATERGEHSYRAGGLPGAAGVLRVDGEPGPGLYGTGGLRVAAGGRHLETVAGAPFLWLADTWWEALTDRVSDAELAQLSARRAGQGFSVIQLVAGLYPEMAPFSREGSSRSGWAWQPGFASPNEAWFDDADTRVRLIVDHRLVPCIVGAWGFYLQHMTTGQMVRHWRELLAWWGAYPVVWCLAGEVTALDHEQVLAAAARLQDGSPGPGTVAKLAGRAVRQAVSSAAHSRPKGFPDSKAIATLLGLRSAISEQVGRWTQVARAVRALEPFGRPFTVHPQPAWPPYEVIDDPGLIDFWLLQTGHSGYHTLAPSVAQLEHACGKRPRKPAIVGEVCYEGILGSSWHEIQRFLFWSHILSGAAGHTYGAQGLWGFNTENYPGGVGGRWNELTWAEAAQLPGAAHAGLGRRILLTLPWERFEPHPEWVRPHATSKDRIQPYAAGLPGGPRIVYFPVPGLVRNSLGFQAVHLGQLGPHRWQAHFVNPRTGRHEQPFTIDPQPSGTVTLNSGPAGPLPSKEDWILILTTD
jgi:hypothetical protein